MKKNVTDIKDITLESKLRMKNDVDIEKLINLKTIEIKKLVKKIENEINSK